MSVVYTFVCDNCGNQKYLGDTGSNFPEKQKNLGEGEYEVQQDDEGNVKAVAYALPSLNSSFGKSGAYSSSSILSVEKLADSKPNLFYEVHLSFIPIKNHTPGMFRSANHGKFSFCSKTCFVNFVDKNLNEDGSISKSTKVEIAT